MTILVVALLGAGVLFVASAMDNTPILETFKKIVSGQPLDWTGGGTPTQLSPADAKKTAASTGGTKPDAQGNCPAGTQNVGGVCIPNSVLGQI